MRTFNACLVGCCTVMSCLYAEEPALLLFSLFCWEQLRDGLRKGSEVMVEQPEFCCNFERLVFAKTSTKETSLKLGQRRFKSVSLAQLSAG